jgi:copper transport protein
LGAVNRRRLVPRLRRAAAGDEPPGSAGAWLARTLRSELALGLAAVAATGALAGYAPSVDAARGPYSTGATLGPAKLTAVVAPATAGPNTIRLDLSDRASGHPYRAVKELTVTAAMPEDGMAAIPLRVHDAGGGRFRLDAVPLAPAGDWMLTVTARVSDFDEYTTHLKVIIR